MAGKSFLRLGQAGIGTQTQTERNAGVSTETGTMTYNVTTEKVQVYSGDTDGWKNVDAPASASGGTETTPGNGYKYHYFNPATPSPQRNLTITGGALTVEILAIGGGGGGGGRNSDGSDGGGGGGAGGVAHVPEVVLPAGTYNVSTGTGGAGAPDAPGGSNVNQPGANGTAPYNGIQGTPGNDTTFDPGGTYSLVAKGGGGGGSGPNAQNAGPGGSGGGHGAGGGSSYVTGGSATQPNQNNPYPATVNNYGNAGGDTDQADPHNGAGGGGAGGGGGPSPDGTGEGGSGRAFPDFTGPLIGDPNLNPFSGTYAGGGGGGDGGPTYPGNPAPGGPGGGGAGATVNVNAANAAATGGGGGGGSGLPGQPGPDPNAEGGNGGNGFLVIRYQV